MGEQNCTSFTVNSSFNTLEGISSLEGGWEALLQLKDVICHVCIGETSWAFCDQKKKRIPDIIDREKKCTEDTIIFF